MFHVFTSWRMTPQVEMDRNYIRTEDMLYIHVVTDKPLLFYSSISHFCIYFKRINYLSPANTNVWTILASNLIKKKDRNQQGNDSDSYWPYALQQSFCQFWCWLHLSSITLLLFFQHCWGRQWWMDGCHSVLTCCVLSAVVCLTSPYHSVVNLSIYFYILYSACQVWIVLYQ